MNRKSEGLEKKFQIGPRDAIEREYTGANTKSGSYPRESVGRATILYIQMVFVWDEHKNRANRRKHGLSFETAARVFEDRNAISYLDRVVDGEERWHTIGAIGGIVVVLVVHTSEETNCEEEIRIISARKATPRERALYNSSQ